MTKIKDLKDKDSLCINLLVKGCIKGVTSKGSPYLNLTFQDDSGTMEGKLWDVKPADEELIAVGHVMAVTCEVLEYNHALQLRVNKIQKVDEGAIDLNDFVMSSKMSRAEQTARVKAAIASLQNENYRRLVQGMFDLVGDRFYQYPAAAKIHHNFLGGLAEHTLGMVAIAEDLVKLYPLLNRDLLVAGVLVHDLGKTEELSGPVTTEYTVEGKLTGHISIEHGWLMEVAEKLGLEDTEEAVLLRHMVLSHHGHYEFGSPVLPQVPEAEALCLIDNLDARMNTLKQALESVKPGEFTQKLFALEGRQFYRAKD